VSIQLGEPSKVPQWRRILSESIVTAGQLGRKLPVSPETAATVIETYPMRINPYFLSLIREPGDPIARQVVPDPAELFEGGLDDPDPLTETAQSPVPCLVHRYPDRALFLVSNQCAVYCRHCMRKRAVGGSGQVTPAAIDRGIDYIRSTPAVREVLLSGGDPLLLSDNRLREILRRLREIPHVELLRIHTRVPGALPQRVTGRLAGMLRRFNPLYLNIQFNHPDELTPEAVSACARLADAGIPLGSQTVLLKGVNDRPEVMIELMRKLLASRVRPYYLHHPDPVRGTGHFRVPVETGLAIMAHIRGNISGMGVPCYVIDLPGGGGKVPLLPDYGIRCDEDGMAVRNFEGKWFRYNF